MTGIREKRNGNGKPVNELWFEYGALRVAVPTLKIDWRDSKMTCIVYKRTEN